MPSQWTVSLGEATERLQEKYDVSRERQDAFAARSHRLAELAWNDGFYDDLVVGVHGADVDRDESIRPGSSVESLAKLTPSFRQDGTITAGNASRQSDSWVFDHLYRSGRIELELVPQGNLAERMRAAGAGIGAFFSPTGVGTPPAEGKEQRTIAGRDYVLEYRSAATTP
jgi:acetyl-CoA acetyltransferase